MHTVVWGSNPFAYADLADAFASFSIPRTVFWPYFTGFVLLAMGLFIIFKNDVPEAHGMDKLMPFGRLFYALPMAVFGTEHFVFDLVALVPRWIPGHRFWVYFVGAALISASLSIIVNRFSQLAATLLGIMILVFVLTIHIPHIVDSPGNRFFWAIGLRDVAFSGGAFAFAGTQSQLRSSSAPSLLVTLARFFIALPCLFFGVEHFLHPQYLPGVPLDKRTPPWIPFPILWSLLTGVVLLPAGVALVLKKNARLAATCLGLMILLLILFIYLPMVLSNPSSIGNDLNFFVDTLAFGGAALLIANAMPGAGKDHSHV